MLSAIKFERSIASRLGSLVVSTLAHGGLGFAVVAGSAHLKNISPGVEVTFRPSLLAPPAPAALAVRAQRRARPTRLKIPAKVVLLQPNRMPVPEPPESTNTGYPGDEAENGVEGGVIGGVVGGSVGGQANGRRAAPEGPPVLLGAGMTRPVPMGECSPSGTRPKPATPEQARQMSITGTVLVEYIVYSDGSVGQITMRNKGPLILFDAVRIWLQECSFSPSLSGTRPIAVRVIQPFVFQTSG